MATTVTAIYEDGVLRLLTPCPLPEHTPVEVPPGSGPVDARDRVRGALVVAGLSHAAEPWAGPPLLSAEERAALAQTIPADRPLSEIIDEEHERRNSDLER